MRYLLAIIAGLAFVSLNVAYADGYSQQLDKPVNGYIANVDYDSYTPEIDPDAQILFSFQLWNKDRSEPVPFDSAFVQISNGSSTPENNYAGVLYSGQINHPSIGDAGISYKFREAGEYQITVDFLKDDNALAEATFPLVVSKPSWSFVGYQMLIGVAITLITLFAAYLLGRRHGRTP